MQKIFLVRSLVGFLMLSLLILSPSALAAETADVTEVTAEVAGVSAEAANTATAEAVSTVNEAGMLIEIGNTTAEETTIIVRVNNNGTDVDKTVQVTGDTKIVTDSNRLADLSDWIAGDHISYTAEEGDNSGELVALVLRNKSFKNWHRGKNGWVKALRPEANEMDVEWAGKIYTLDTTDAKMVAGLKNPASLSDFEVGDRVRARVQDDGDGNELTWDANIIVVLRRGGSLFMRVTRWVVPAEIVAIPEDTSTYPYLITAKVKESKFYEKGDVNNLIGEPGTEFTIQVDEDTKLVRRYLGKSVIGEFSEGDHIRVVGRLSEETGYLDAEVIKNNSIQRLGVSNRIGEVLSVDVAGNTFVATPIGVKNPLTGKRHKIGQGGDWTVMVDDETMMKEKGTEISLSDLEVGDIVRVRGVANRIQKTVDADRVAVLTEHFNKWMEILK